MAPVVLALEQSDCFESVVCVTAQHRAMLDQVLNLFEIVPQYDLDVMKPNQDLYQVTAAVLLGLKPVFEKEQPHMVLVHGDTTTTMATALAAFYQKIPVGHVEAGLRTWDPYYPFPEEMNRVITDNIAQLYFAPTPLSKNNLLKCGIAPEKIAVTGNTVIDALLYTLERDVHTTESLGEASVGAIPVLEPDKRLILMTVHRRENFGAPLLEICRAITTLCQLFKDIVVVIPVHPNPNVSQTIYAQLGNHPQVQLIPPQDYAPFCQLMAKATLILTDSGGIQEEAPSLSKPVLVLRDETERPEAVELGTVKLVGPHYETIVEASTQLLKDPDAYAAMAKRHNPYGDGKAARHIVNRIQGFFEKTAQSELATALE